MVDLVKVVEWFANGDGGMSSKAIVAHMSGANSDGSYPHDPADLGRCLRMLEIFPEWKARMPEMSVYGKEWARLSERWSDLHAAMDEEVGIDWSKQKSAPETYRLMKEVIGR